MIRFYSVSTLTTVSILALSLFSPANVKIQEKGEQDQKWYRATAIVSVNSDFGADTHQLNETILSNREVLTSIFPKLRPGAADTNRPEYFYVEGASVAEGTLSINITGTFEGDVSSLLKLLIENLSKFEPSQAVSVRRRLELIEKEYKECQATYAEAKSKREEFIQKNGTLSPAELLDRAHGELLQKMSEIDEARFQNATETATRDLLKELLAKEPATVEMNRTVPNSKKMLLQKQLEAISTVALGSVLEKSITPSQLKDFLESQQKWVAEIEKQLIDPNLTDTIVVEKVDNQRRAELEQQLFDTDRRLAETKSRETVLEKRVLFLHNETITLSKFAASYDLVNDEYNNALNDYNAARENLRNVKAEARSIVNGQWIKLLAGPTVQKYN